MNAVFSGQGAHGVEVSFPHSGGQLPPISSTDLDSIKIGWDLTLRAMEVSDLPAVRKFLQGMDSITLDEWEDDRLWLKVLDSQPGLSRVIEHPEDGIVACAFGEGHIRGMIHRFAVATEYRKLGIGSTLLESMLEKFSDSGIKMVQLTVVSDNQRAMAFWEKKGFREREGRVLMAKVQ